MVSVVPCRPVAVAHNDRSDVSSIKAATGLCFLCAVQATDVLPATDRFFAWLAGFALVQAASNFGDAARRGFFFPRLPADRFGINLN
jgi:hypothetical protein